jgi:hypothetical protein
MKMKAKLQSSLDVAQNALHGGEVRLSRIMHKQANMLNCISDIRTSEGKILKCTSNTAIVGWISHRNTINR